MLAVFHHVSHRAPVDVAKVVLQLHFLQRAGCARPRVLVLLPEPKEKSEQSGS